MKKNIKLPAPQLSQLKEVNIDLDMKGRHYAEIATSEGHLPEEVAKSILDDLMDEDANLLTVNELRYLFMLVKINSLENNYKVTVTCTHTLKDGTTCGHENVKDIKLSDADLKYTRKNYKPPVIKFAVDDSGDKEWIVLPPTVDIECALLNWIMNEKSMKIEEILTDGKISFEYTLLRSICHLVDSKTNERYIKGVNEFTELYDKILDIKM